jgi:hypothetical protein
MLSHEEYIVEEVVNKRFRHGKVRNRRKTGMEFDFGSAQFFYVACSVC